MRIVKLLLVLLFGLACLFGPFWIGFGILEMDAIGSKESWWYVPMSLSLSTWLCAGVFGAIVGGVCVISTHE